jgi:hypothetical protein
MKKLLNIDGGGIRIYFSLLILNYIEKRTNKKIIDMFDFYAGVSASSIILAALLTKYSVEEMLVLFKDISKKIFYKSYFYTITSGFGFFSSKYPDTNVNYELEKLLGDEKMSSVKKPLIILTYDLVNTKSKNFHSYKNNDYKLWEVVRSSTAAPTYFPPYKLDEFMLIDGGVVTNNLSEYIFINALDYYGHDEEFFQVSIGTGTYNHKFDYPPSGLWSWGSSIIDVFFSATSTYEMNSLNKISKFEKLKSFYRIDINLTNPISLDDYNSFEMIEEIYNKWLENNKNYLDTICDELEKLT